MNCGVGVSDSFICERISISVCEIPYWNLHVKFFTLPSCIVLTIQTLGVMLGSLFNSDSRQQEASEYAGSLCLVFGGKK